MVLVKAHLPPAEAETTDSDRLDRLAADLAAPEIGLRRAAARRLADLPEAAPLLCRHLARGDQPSVRSIILTGLILHKSRRIAQTLLGLLAQDDTQLRGEIIDALQEMPDEVAPHMQHLLTDPDSTVRLAAIAILAGLAHPSVPGWLAQTIAVDEHVNVCAAALDVLAEVGSPASVPMIRALAERFPDVGYIQFAVDAAIGRIGLK